MIIVGIIYILLGIILKVYVINRSNDPLKSSIRMLRILIIGGIALIIGGTLNLIFPSDFWEIIRIIVVGCIAFDLAKNIKLRLKK